MSDRMRVMDADTLLNRNQMSLLNARELVVEFSLFAWKRKELLFTRGCKRMFSADAWQISAKCG